jgi:hypothetical protein
LLNGWVGSGGATGLLSLNLHVFRRDNLFDFALWSSPMPNLAIWASGYPSVFSNDASEVSSLQAGTWSPASVDFRAAATRSGAAAGAGTFDELLHQIARQKPGSIEQLGIIAHSNAKMIGLAGKIITTPPDAPDVLFSQAGLIDDSVLQAKAGDIATITDRFADHASITLFSCNAGADLSLLIAFQTAFGLDCYGFKDEVQTCTTWVTPSLRISVRGRMAYVPGLAAQIQNGAATPCTFAQNSVWSLQPDSGFFSRN